MTFAGTSTVLALAIVGWASTTASSEPISIKIELEAPAGCSDAAAFWDRIHARTDRVRLGAEGESALQLRVKLVRTGGKVRGELRLVDEQGTTDTRKVEGASCEEVVDALSLTAALALDPAARLSLGPPAASASGVPSPPPSGSSAPPATPTPASSASPSPPSNSPTSGRPSPGSPAPTETAWPPSGAARGSEAATVEFGLEGLATEIVSPQVSLGGSLFARVAATPAGPSFGLALLYAADDFLQPAHDVQIRWTAVALTLCPIVWRLGSAFRLEPCALGMGGWLSAGERAISNPESVVRSWWSLGGVASASASVGGGVAIRLQLGVTAPLFQRRFITTMPEQVVGETPGASALGTLGIAFSL